MPSAGDRVRSEAAHVYAVAIGSNRASRVASDPRAMIAWALARLDEAPCTLLDTAPVAITAPVGPAQRRFANAAALVVSRLAPDAMLAHCQAIERAAGRRRARRWGPRPLDLDLLLWTGGIHASATTLIPHPMLAQRDFVLDPLARIAADWRDPLTGHTVRQLYHRLHRAQPVDHLHDPV